MSHHNYSPPLQRLRQSTGARWAGYFLMFELMVAILAPFIASHKPIYCKLYGETLYPLFSFKSAYTLTNPTTQSPEILNIDQTDWQTLPLETAVWPLVPYSPGRSDMVNANYVSPYANQQIRDTNGNLQPASWWFTHHLGTNQLGADVLAGIIHGTRITFWIAFLSVFIQAFMGITIGALAGYFANGGLYTTLAHTIAAYLALVPAWFYGLYLWRFWLLDALAVGWWLFLIKLLFCLALSIALFFSIRFLLAKALFIFSPLRKRVTLNIDNGITRIIEIINSVPALMLIIAFAGITQNFFAVLIVIIGFAGWTGIARLVRAEMLRVRSLDYIVAAKSQGLPTLRIVLTHALPNAIQPAIVAIVFSLAATILTESSLSFLGAFNISEVTWGSLLADGRANFSAWWLVVFPGLAIFLTIVALNVLGEALRDALDPKNY